MTLIAVARPSSEPESAAMVCLLQANEIPCLVHGAGLAGMLPGLQISSFNTPTIMVPSDAAAQAVELLSVFAPSPSATPSTNQISASAKLRMIAETLLFGLFVSEPTAHANEAEDGS
jgi:phosphoribosylcarboxyaminoimidazole (NCAIR) mutase